MLGRPWTIEGKLKEVTKEEKIGFPTCNLDLKIICYQN